MQGQRRDAGMVSWTIEVLSFTYCIFFHHFPHMTLSFVLRPKGVTEAIHQGATGGYMVGPHLTVNSLTVLAVVTVFILWRLEV